MSPDWSCDMLYQGRISSTFSLSQKILFFHTVHILGVKIPLKFCSTLNVNLSHIRDEVKIKIQIRKLWKWSQYASTSQCQTSAKAGYFSLRMQDYNTAWNNDGEMVVKKAWVAF